MLRQCAGCGTCFDDGSGKENEIPRPYGCCAECNKTTFRSNEKKEEAPAAEAPVEESAT